MKKIAALSLIAFTAGCMQQQEPMEMSAAAQSELMQAIGDRVAGPPQACVQQRSLGGNRSAGEEAIIFQGVTSATLYVNRPAAGCPELNSGRALITRTPSTQLCRGDIVNVVDPVSGFHYGSCSLGDFTPYRRLR